MSRLLQQPSTARPLGALGLALAGLMLMGFHQVVNGALERAQQQREQGELMAESDAACSTLRDEAQRELCRSRAEQRLAMQEAGSLATSP